MTEKPKKNADTSSPRNAGQAPDRSAADGTDSAENAAGGGKTAGREVVSAADSAPAVKAPTLGLAIGYFVARFGIFLVIAGVFWLLNFRGLPGALAAAIISIPVSFFVLGSMRVRVAQQLEQRKSASLGLKAQFRDSGKDGAGQ